MNPTTDTGATEFLANLSVSSIVLAALCLTLLRLLILQVGGAMRPRSVRLPDAGSSGHTSLKMGGISAGGDAGFTRGLAEILESLIIAGVLVFLVIRPFFVQAFFIPSESMENTLLGHDAGQPVAGNALQTHKDTVHDHIFVNKLVYRFGSPHRGDIVVFRAPKEADAEHKFSGAQVENVLIKRLMGVPGDTIEIKDGRVYRNGEPLNEFHQDKDGNLLSGYPYSIREQMDENLEGQFNYATHWRGGPLKLGPHQYWVMGDNRNDSNDSRYWGPLDDWRVIGKASVIFWPLGRIRLLH